MFGFDLTLLFIKVFKKIKEKVKKYKRNYCLKCKIVKLENVGIYRDNEFCLIGFFKYKCPKCGYEKNM